MILVQVDDFPLVLQLRNIEDDSFYHVSVLLGDALNSAKHVHELVVEAGHAVVVPGFI